MFVFWRGTGQQCPATGTGALGAADLGAAYALLEVIAINPTIEPPELTKYWGNSRDPAVGVRNGEEA